MMQTRPGRKYIVLSLILAVSIALPGCGPEKTRDGETQSALSNPPAQTIDWDAYRISAPGSVENGELWHLAEYHDDWVTRPEGDYNAGFSLYAGLWGGTIYGMFSYSHENPENGDCGELYHMNIFDARTGQSLCAALDPAGWGLPENSLLVDMDMADEELAVFLARSFEENGLPISCCSLVFYHTKEGVQRTLDLLPALASAGITQSTGFHLDSTQKNILCDREGRCYLLWENRLLVVDTDGTLLYNMEQDTGVTLSCLCKTPEGFPVFVRTDADSRVSTYWLYDCGVGEMRSLGETKSLTLRFGCMDSQGNLYYFSNDKIVKWNIQSGKREIIFDCGAGNICSNTNALKVTAIRENGDLVIMDSIAENNNIYVLTPTPPKVDRTLTLVSACPGTQLEQTAASLFSMKNPGVKIEFSEYESSGTATRADWETYTANLVNRIVAGDAPDMFIVPEETMHILYEKGALADLTDMIPHQVQEQVFDCVWNAGTIDGKLTGLTTQLSCSSILVSDTLWSKDTWTLEDILALAEEETQTGTLQGLIPLKGYNPQATDVLQWLALKNLDASFVDMESGVSHFDSPAFRKLLEYCKNTPVPASNPDSQDTAPARSVQSGEYLAYACDIYDIADFSFQMSLFGNDYHWVGVPTRGECGNQVYATTFLVVSKDSPNMDLIREFLPTLYGDEVERMYPDNCLRKDVLRERVTGASEWDARAQFRMGEGVCLMLECKPDGSSYVEDYIAFMDSCVLMPFGDDTIASIVLEEVPAYFSGDKNLDVVISVIQSRVQLYLDENHS